MDLLCGVSYEGRELGTVRDIKLLEDSVKVSPDRMLAQGKPRRDLLVGTPLAHQLDDLSLPAGSVVSPPRC